MSLTPEQIENLTATLQPETLLNETYAVHNANYREYAKKVWKDLNFSGTFTMLNPVTTKYLRSYSGYKITKINRTTQKKIISELIEGVKLGEGIPVLAKRIDSVFDYSTGRRAAMIARTEVVGASNNATYAVHKTSGVVQNRRWISVFDSRTRDIHASLNGMIVGINEKFVMGGYSSYHPGGFNVARMDINCRCTTVAVIDDSFKSFEYLSKKFDIDIMGWESELKRSFRKAFEKQRRELQQSLLHV